MRMPAVALELLVVLVLGGNAILVMSNTTKQQLLLWTITKKKQLTTKSQIQNQISNRLPTIRYRATISGIIHSQRYTGSDLL